MFTTRDIADYYNQTQNHYEIWWNLDKGLSLHYGVWDEHTRNFTEALENTNRILLDTGKITSEDRVLDAGCGVGGAAIFMAKEVGARVTGITLSHKQVTYGNEKAQEHHVSELVNIEQQDYMNTSFEDETFDAVWACESISSATSKDAFAREVYRVLKKGGRLVLSDCFKTSEDQQDPKEWIKKWGETWGVAGLTSADTFIGMLEDAGFTIKHVADETKRVDKSARRMYYAYLLGALPSMIYNTLFKTSRFAKTHYLSGLYQYKALREGLWEYKVILAEK